MTTAAAIAPHLADGCRVAISDGAGSPLSLGGALSDAVPGFENVSLLLGWSLRLPDDLELCRFGDVRALMGGYANRRLITDGQMRYVPARVSVMPALLAGPLRVDVLLAGVRRTRRGFVFATESSWLDAIVRCGARVLAQVNHGLPDASACDPIPDEQVVVIDEVDRPPIEQPISDIDAATSSIGRRVAALIPEGATIQFPPGRLGRAVLDALDVPVRVSSGVLTDPVVDLAERGLLLGTPRTAYVVGTQRLYQWVDGRSVVAPISETHDAFALARERFFAVSTTLELDEYGQLNVQGLRHDVIAGVGGQPDFALAGAMSVEGLSIVATPTHDHHGRSILVGALSDPASTLRSDVDLVVTQHGCLDLRGLDDNARKALLTGHWTDGDRQRA